MVKLKINGKSDVKYIVHDFLYPNNHMKPSNIVAMTDEQADKLFAAIFNNNDPLSRAMILHQLSF